VPNFVAIVVKMASHKLCEMLHRLVASLLIMGGRFPKILDLFSGFKIGVPSGCLEKTSIFKIIMIDDVTL